MATGLDFTRSLSPDRCGVFCEPGRAEVRRFLGRRCRERQARGSPHRRDPAGRQRGVRRRLRHGRHDRRPARPRAAGEPAASGARTRHAADRRGAHLDGGAGDGDQRARAHRAVVHRLPGRGHHRRGARQGSHHRRHPRAHPQRAGRRAHRDRRRVPGREPDDEGRDDARPRRLGHDRRRARGRPRRRRLRDLHRRRRRVHRRPADRADRAAPRPRLHRGDARAGRQRREDPCCGAWNTPAATTSPSTCVRRSPTRTAR